MGSLLKSFGIPVPADISETSMWGVNVFFTLLALVLIRFMVMRLFRKKRDASDGIDFGAIDKMKGSGAVTDEEAKLIRQAMARRLMERSQAEQNADRERAILLAAAADPDAARALLPPEIRNRNIKEDAPVAPPPAEIKPAPAPPAEAAPPPKPAPASPRASQGTTSLGEAPPPEPAMNMVKVAEAKRAQREAVETARQSGQPAPRGELDALLEKGAISREEYERLKQYFQ